MPLAVLILNFNGRRLLAECLPSVIKAAQASRHAPRVVVIDNGSSDDSRSFLQSQFPEVEVIDRPNLGLISYNGVLAEFDCDVAVLLNNDVKLAEDCLDRLVAPLMNPSGAANRCFMTAPQCRKFDGLTCEGLKTAVRWRWGLVQASCCYPGYTKHAQRPGWTASAGPVMAVHRQRFLELGGFDPLYLPGRLEDLDFAFRGYLAGYHARYVPEALAYHQGGATFTECFGPQGCDDLALRNTLLFQWKNLRHPLHIARHVAGLTLRLLAEPLRATGPRPARWRLVRALQQAVVRWRQMAARPSTPITLVRLGREWRFFYRFHPRRIDRPRAESPETAIELAHLGGQENETISIGMEAAV
jgi:GT2 family glycosyltransferase